MAIKKLLYPVLLGQAVFISMAASVGAAAGYDEARVLEVSPVYETVRYSSPREECRQERVSVYDDSYEANRYRRKSKSAVPGIVGAIIGGAIGNGLGHNKTNKRVGTAVGAILGGAIGSDIAKKNARFAQDNYPRNERRYTTQEVCTVIEDWQSEQRLSGYDVTYSYAGETYSTRTDTHPGDTIKVHVNVTPAY